MNSDIEIRIMEGIPDDTRQQQIVTVTPEQVGKTIEAIIAARIRTSDKPLLSFIVKTYNEQLVEEETIIRVVNKGTDLQHYWI